MLGSPQIVITVKLDDGRVNGIYIVFRVRVRPVVEEKLQHHMVVLKGSHDQRRIAIL